MTKKDARDFLEKKLVFNEQMEEWEKESQSEFFLELLDNWSKEDIIASFLWFENLIMKQNEEYENMEKQNINELKELETAVEAVVDETTKVEETKEVQKFDVSKFYFTVSNATAFFDKENNHERPSVTFKVNDVQKVRIGLKPKTFIEKLANDQCRFSGKNIESIKGFTNSLRADVKQTVEKLSSFDLKQFKNVQMIHFTKVLDENKDLLKSKELESEQENQKSEEMEM